VTVIMPLHDQQTLEAVVNNHLASWLEQLRLLGVQAYHLVVVVHVCISMHDVKPGYC
jgi:hypothetical protein